MIPAQHVVSEHYYCYWQEEALYKIYCEPSYTTFSFCNYFNQVSHFYNWIYIWRTYTKSIVLYMLRFVFFWTKVLQIKNNNLPIILNFNDTTQRQNYSETQRCRSFVITFTKSIFHRPKAHLRAMVKQPR